MKYQIRKSLVNYEIKTYLDKNLVLPENSIDCSLGINPCGHSKKVNRELFTVCFDKIHKYPPYPYLEFKKMISTYYSSLVKIDLDQVVPQVGSMGMLMHLNRYFIDHDVRVILNGPSFTSAIADMKAMGAKIDFVKLEEENDYKFSVEKFLRFLKPEHQVVYIDNPNNPTGQSIAAEDIAKIAAVCEKQGAVVFVDEAYGDFMDFDNTAISLVNDYDNIFVVKSFSKGYALPALRVGYGIIPKPFIPQIAKIPPEMVVTNVGVEMAKISLTDYEHIAESRRKIKANKKRIIDSLKKLKVSETDYSVPITMIYTDKDINLYKLFLKYGVICESGTDFDIIGERYIRLRVPAQTDELIKRIARIEEEI